MKNILKNNKSEGPREACPWSCYIEYYVSVLLFKNNFINEILNTGDSSADSDMDWSENSNEEEIEPDARQK